MVRVCCAKWFDPGGSGNTVLHTFWDGLVALAALIESVHLNSPHFNSLNLIFEHLPPKKMGKITHWYHLISYYRNLVIGSVRFLCCRPWPFLKVRQRLGASRHERRPGQSKRICELKPPGGGGAFRIRPVSLGVAFWKSAALADFRSKNTLLCPSCCNLESEFGFNLQTAEWADFILSWHLPNFFPGGMSESEVPCGLGVTRVTWVDSRGVQSEAWRVPIDGWNSPS